MGESRRLGRPRRSGKRDHGWRRALSQGVAETDVLRLLSSNRLSPRLPPTRVKSIRPHALRLTTPHDSSLLSPLSFFRLMRLATFTLNAEPSSPRLGAMLGEKMLDLSRCAAA